MNWQSNQISNSCINCPCRSPMFDLLDREELELVFQNKMTIHFKKGETIRKQGTHMSHVISLNAGMVKLYLEGINHKNTIIRMVTPTSFIGGPGIFLDQIHHFSISAIQDSTICFIDMLVFKQILENNRRFSEEFMKDLSRNMLSIYQRLIDLTQKQLAGRLADSLLYLFNDVFKSNSFEMCISKQDIADLTGVSLDSTLKTLREFKTEGIINYTHGSMELLNPDALLRISRTG